MSIIEKIINKKNIYLDSENKDSNFESLNKIPSSKIINTNQLCIYEIENNEIKDIECITGAELKAYYDMPNFRKYEVCINDSCLDKESVKILNGTQNFELKSRYHLPEFKDKCIGYGELEAHQCIQSHQKGGANPDDWSFKLQSLMPVECNNNELDPAEQGKISSYFSFEKAMSVEDKINLLIQEPLDLKKSNPLVPPEATHNQDMYENLRPDDFE